MSIYECIHGIKQIEMASHFSVAFSEVRKYKIRSKKKEDGRNIP